MKRSFDIGSLSLSVSLSLSLSLSLSHTHTHTHTLVAGHVCPFILEAVVLLCDAYLFEKYN